MGRRLQFKGRFDEGTITSNQPSSTNLGNQKASATNMAVYTDHTLFSHQSAVSKSCAKRKISKCRFCQKPNHDIKSCHPFHTNGEGIVQDDDSTRKFGYSIMYFFCTNPASNTQLILRCQRIHQDMNYVANLSILRVHKPRIINWIKKQIQYRRQRRANLIIFLQTVTCCQ